jgi:hypothetical protein
MEVSGFLPCDDDACRPTSTRLCTPSWALYSVPMYGINKVKLKLEYLQYGLEIGLVI